MSVDVEVRRRAERSEGIIKTLFGSSGAAFSTSEKTLKRCISLQSRKDGGKGRRQGKLKGFYSTKHNAKGQRNRIVRGQNKEERTGGKHRAQGNQRGSTCRQQDHIHITIP